jgi:tartrate-resistant acid phosphatase type 5
MRYIILSLFVALSGCDDAPLVGRSAPDAGVRSFDASADPEDGGASAADAGGGERPDAGGETTDAGTVIPDAGAAPDAGSFSRFIAIGDSGTGSSTQHQVAISIAAVCEALGGCDFGLLLGDNVYNSGVDGVDDPRWMVNFVEPYGDVEHACAANGNAATNHDVRFPFYAVLGNHDLGGDGLGVDLDPDKGNYQVQYSEVNDQWRMPALHYRLTEGPLFLVGLNTTEVFWGRDDQQRADVRSWLGEAGGRWKIAFGHHPYVSNGPHGNAGNYEGLSFLPLVNGRNVKDFIDEEVCGTFDLYLCGHDHSRQDLGRVCGTEFIVSGAGAKTTDLDGDNSTHFESDVEGFLLVEAWERRLTLNFYHKDGRLEHSREIRR